MVVVAIPAFIFLFLRIHLYYRRTGRALGLGVVPEPPSPRRTLVVVPVTGVSRLTRRALSEALSLGQEVRAITVILDYSEEDEARISELQNEWARWNPGAPLEVLRTEYASVVDPIVSYIDDLCRTCDDQIVVLIPNVIPRRLRYRILHNQLDLVLSAALRSQPDVVVARVGMRVDE